MMAIGLFHILSVSCFFCVTLLLDIVFKAYGNHKEGIAVILAKLLRLLWKLLCSKGITRAISEVFWCWKQITNSLEIRLAQIGLKQMAFVLFCINKRGNKKNTLIVLIETMDMNFESWVT